MLMQVVEETEETEGTETGLTVEEEGECRAGSAGSAHSGPEKDSGISRTTDSDPELLPPPRSPSGFSASSAEDPNSPPARLRQLEAQLSGFLGDFLSGEDVTPTAALPLPDGPASPRGEESDASLQRELASLHREMETVRIECDRLIAHHATAEQRVLRQVHTAQSLLASVDSLARNTQAHPQPPSPAPPAQPPRHCPPAPSPAPARPHISPPDAGASQLRRLAHQKRSGQGQGQETSSAYNTGGESCRSTPLNSYPEEKRDSGLYTGFPPFVQPVMVPELSSVLRQGSASRGGRLSADWNNGYHSPVQPQRQTVAGSRKSSVACGSNEGFAPGQVMYARAEEVEATIALQQRLLRQAMLAQAEELRSRQALTGGPVVPAAVLGPAHVEWKIKRRSDGSRYVTRRPVRNKILKERAAQLSNERTGLSTDDDAFSELKVGPSHSALPSPVSVWPWCCRSVSIGRGRRRSGTWRSRGSGSGGRRSCWRGGRRRPRLPRTPPGTPSLPSPRRSRCGESPTRSTQPLPLPQSPSHD